MKYIITYEDGNHFIASEITDSDMDAFSEGILSIIKISNCTQLNSNGEWESLPKWGQ